MAAKRNSSGLTSALPRPSLDNEELVSSRVQNFKGLTRFFTESKQKSCVGGQT